jgi:acyl-CoA reductase-like NAD-dependent aldehyde dehydrogenase
MDVFREASLPVGCLNLVLPRLADAAMTMAIIAALEVRMINLTGSSDREYH